MSKKNFHKFVTLVSLKVPSGAHIRTTNYLLEELSSAAVVTVNELCWAHAGTQAGDAFNKHTFFFKEERQATERERERERKRHEKGWR